MFRQILVITAAAVSFASIVEAADLPSRKAVIAPPVEATPIYAWTGYYAGLTVGYDWSQSKDRVMGADTLTMNSWQYPGEINSPKINPTGFIGGAQAGYNLQLSPATVAGIEGDLSGSSLNGKALAPGTVDPSRLMTGTERMDVFGTLRGRVGYLPSNQLLAYLTGGLAYGHGSLKTGLSRPGFSPGPPPDGCGGNNNCQTGSAAYSRLGWTAGVGLEWAISKDWSAKAEYLYYDLGSVSHLMTDPAFPSTIFRARAPLTGNIMRAGLEYHFSAPAPTIVAKD